ncbi:MULTISPECIES: tripartite tricarboxylate transporter substrate binding protein [unclassified Knoellia]|uniref:tripartite tricarboxylate transporter substrate binding protein n=1 Tax=Knoellia altitudinis TaxID=3404795 RepID=UPI00361CB748
MNITRLTAGALAAAVAVTLSACGSSQTPAGSSSAAFPPKGKTVEIIVPSAAGAGNDILARILAPRLEKELGTNVQVVNKEGGGQVIGLTALAKAKPDGLTIGFTNLPSVLGRYMDPSKKATFNRESFAPVASFATNAVVIAVNAKSPHKDLQSLLDAAKANPGKLNAATDSRAGDDHINLVRLQESLGVTYNIVHFDSGADKVAALVGQQVDFIVGGVSSVFGPYKSGDLRILAVVDDEASPFMPDVPTLKGLGFTQDTMTSLFTLSAPAGTPAATVAVLEKAIQTAVADAAVQQKMKDTAVNASFTPAKEVSSAWKEREDATRPVIEAVLAK